MNKYASKRNREGNVDQSQYYKKCFQMEKCILIVCRSFVMSKESGSIVIANICFHLEIKIAVIRLVLQLGKCLKYKKSAKNKNNLGLFFKFLQYLEQFRK